MNAISIQSASAQAKAKKENEANTSRTWAEMSRDQQLRTAHAMLICGGAFVRSLSLAMTKADTDNLRRIHTAFPELAIQYGPASGAYKQTHGEQS